MDRKKNLIISGGVNVYPRDIEEIVMSHAVVLEVAVFGLADANWCEAPVAAVRTNACASAGPEEVRAWVNERVSARYQKVLEVVVKDEFSLNVAGKTLRRVLRDQYLERYPSLGQ